MNAPTPLAVREANAARMLDLKRDVFLRLVACGALPAPVRLGDDIELWRTSDLEAILNGNAAKPQQDEAFEL